VISYKGSVGWDNIIPQRYQKKYGQGVDGEYYDGETRKTSLVWGPRLDTTDLPTYNHYDFFRQGITTDHSLSFQGSSDKTTYFASISQFNQKGTVPHNEFGRTSFMAKYNAQLTDRLSLSAKITYVRSENDRLPEGNSLSTIMWTILCGPITYNFDPAVDEDGDQRLYRTPLRNNPYWLAENTRFEETRDRFMPNFGLDYQFTDWLKLSAKAGIDQYSSLDKYWENAGIRGTYPDGRLDETSRVYREFNSDIILSANKTFGDLSTILLVGNNINTQYYQYQRVQGSAFIIPGFYHLDNATSHTTTEGSSFYRMYSYYGQAEIGYKSMLYATLTGRNDWSSTLPADNNSYFYSSASLGFVFTELLEPIQEILPFGKLRLSIAQVGNDAPLYATQTAHIKANPGDGQRGNIDYPFNGQGSYLETNIMGNPELKPEISTEYEIGADLRFLDNRINLDFAYYDKVSKNQIFRAPIASETGFVNRLINAGEISNKGVEIQFNVIPVKTDDFGWEINLNWGKNKNKVVSLADDVESIRLAGFTSPGIFIRQGEAYGVIWGSRYARNEEGKVIIDDDPESYYYGMPVTDDDLGPIGYTTPDWVGGLRNTVSWKGISVSALIDMRKGGDLMNLDENYTSFYGTSIKTEDREHPVIFQDAVKATDGAANDIEVDPATFYQTMTDINEFYIQKGEFIKLREVSISYSLPKDLLSKVKIQSAYISVSGRNLWMKTDDSFTGSDPEQSLYGSGNGQGFLSFNMPSTKGWNITLNLTF